MEELIVNVGENKKVVAEQKGHLTKFDINYITEVKTIYGDEVIEKNEEKYLICIKVPEEKELIKIHNKYLIVKEDYLKWYVKLVDRKTKDEKDYIVLFSKSVIPQFQSLNDAHPKSVGIWYRKLPNRTYKRLKTNS